MLGTFGATVSYSVYVRGFRRYRSSRVGKCIEICQLSLVREPAESKPASRVNALSISGSAILAGGSLQQVPVTLLWPPTAPTCRGGNVRSFLPSADCHRQQICRHRQEVLDDPHEIVQASSMRSANLRDVVVNTDRRRLGLISRVWIPMANGLKKKPVASVSIEPKDRLLVSQEEAAQLLSISKRSVEYLVAAQRLSIRRIGTRALIPIEDVRRFARADHPERLAS